MAPRFRVSAAIVALPALVWAAVQEPGVGRYPDMPPGRPPVVDVPDASAATQAEMRPYRERIVGVSAEGGEMHLDMAPVPGGEFRMGSPETEPGPGRPGVAQAPCAGRPVLDGDP